MIIVLLLLFLFSVMCRGRSRGRCCCWGVGVYLHIPHLTNMTLCTYVQTGQERRSLEEGGGKMLSFPPTSIEQYPADMDGKVLGGEDRRAEEEVLLKRRLGSL